MGDDITGYQLFSNEIRVSKEEQEREGLVIDEEFAVENVTEDPLEFHELSLDDGENDVEPQSQLDDEVIEELADE